jgi:hypothetical protein
MLRWEQSTVAKKANVSVETVKRLEKLSGPLDAARGATVDVIRRALEEAGIEFLDLQDGVAGPGVRLKWGVEVPHRTQTGTTTGSNDPTLGALSWEDDESGEPLPADIEEMRSYWRERPEQWAAMHKSTRWALLQEMGLAGM